MEQVFDTERVAKNRLRAFRKGQKGADFLLNIVAEELADRLAVVERRFDKAVELHGVTGVVASVAQATGKVGEIARIETDADFADEGEGLSLAPLELPGLDDQSLNLVL